MLCADCGFIVILMDLYVEAFIWWPDDVDLHADEYEVIPLLFFAYKVALKVCDKIGVQFGVAMLVHQVVDVCANGAALGGGSGGGGDVLVENTSVPAVWGVTKRSKVGG